MGVHKKLRKYVIRAYSPPIRIRKDKGLTQEDLVKKSGVAIFQIRRYEADKNSPTLDVVLRLETFELIIKNPPPKGVVLG
ncbi:MAG: helix-turn-helix transcriptional regulator [Deltaproteobacteria bacterium]|nr:helix-turn-helix transcriptional regulator [Deltaproteobacteria bacterium]